MTRVLCTGSAGWVGRLLCQRLEERGYEVYRFDRLVHGRYNPYGERMIYGEIRDYNSCKLAMRKALPSIVVHLAAIATADQYIYDHPNEVTHTNLDGTVNVSNAFGEWAKETNSPAKQFVFASSSEIYGCQNPKDAPFTEELEPHPSNIYGVSKWAAELHLREQWSKTYQIPYTIMRNHNSYANLFYQRTLIDRCTVEMLQGKSSVKLGNATAVRDWEFIDDHVSSYLTVIGNEKAYGESFNFCRGEPYTIKDTVDRIMDATDYTGTVEWGIGHPRRSDVPLLHGDPSKARRVLGWEAKYNLTQGLTEYVTRLREHGNLGRPTISTQ